jgi:hypothetical protein
VKVLNHDAGTADAGRAAGTLEFRLAEDEGAVLLTVREMSLISHALHHYAREHDKWELRDLQGLIPERVKALAEGFDRAFGEVRAQTRPTLPAAHRRVPEAHAYVAAECPRRRRRFEQHLRFR